MTNTKQNRTLIILMILAIFVLAGVIGMHWMKLSENYLHLYGDDVVIISQGENYAEDGYYATNKMNEDLTTSVVVKSNVNTEIPGEYVVSYILGDIIKTRKVIVEEIIPEETEPIIETLNSQEVEEDITFTYKYVVSDDVMSYGLITPSGSKEEPVPLIVSLHGMGERSNNQDRFKEKFVVNTMRHWELEGFNAYVLFPHLYGDWYQESWNNDKSAQNVINLIDRITEEYNIDKNRIYISGQSMGGYGCLYVAAYAPEYFAAIVPISPYNSNTNLKKLADVPIRCYGGSPSHGEDSSSSSFVSGTFTKVFGAENVFQYDVSHDEIPVLAFTLDENNDGKSDLIEWLLAIKKQEISEENIA